jgi:hypothetical protein
MNFGRNYFRVEKDSQIDSLAVLFQEIEPFDRPQILDCSHDNSEQYVRFDLPKIVRVDRWSSSSNIAQIFDQIR